MESCRKAEHRLGDVALCTPSSNTMRQTAPSKFSVVFQLDDELHNFTIHVERNWAPSLADRFYNLATNGFFHEQRFYRVVPGWVVQFGVSGSPEISAVYDNRHNIPGAIVAEDPVRQSNVRGAVSFSAVYCHDDDDDDDVTKVRACNQTTELFINLVDNSAVLDSKGFAPFGMIEKEDMSIVDEFIYQGYGELEEICQKGGTTNPTRSTVCKGPSEERLYLEGNKYLEKNFPKMSFTTSQTITNESRINGGDGDGEQAFLVIVIIFVIGSIIFFVGLVGSKISLRQRRQKLSPDALSEFELL